MTHTSEGTSVLKQLDSIKVSDSEFKSFNYSKFINNNSRVIMKNNEGFFNDQPLIILIPEDEEDSEHDYEAKALVEPVELKICRQ